MKKLILITITLIALIACGGTEPDIIEDVPVEEEAPTEEEAPPEQAPADGFTGSGDTTGACGLIDASAVANILGGDVTATATDPTVCSYSAPSAERNAVVTVTEYDDADAAAAILESQLTSFGGERLEGLGDGAVYVSGNGSLDVQQGSTVYSVVVNEGFGPADDTTLVQQIAALLIGE